MCADSSDVMKDATIKHVCVCICTYKRPHLLRRLLDELADQDTAGKFTYSIVVVDNDQLRSAEPIVLDFTARAAISANYCVESRQNISLARNKAVENARGDFIAFIDDDEFPTRSWLHTLFKTLDERKVDGVLGPVRPHFEQGTPKWVVRGKFYDRPTYPTGLVIDRQKGRTGNVLLKRRIFAAAESPFRPEFRTGEDQDFFGRMIQKGYVFIWCDEAVAYEVIPPSRWKRAFMLRKALLRGACSFLNPDQRGLNIAKSITSIPVYAAALPFALLLGHHRFMTLLVKIFNHRGRLLAVIGINPTEEQYITD